MPQPVRTGIKYTIVAQLGAMGMQFANSVALTRGLGVEQFGLYSIFTNAIITVATIGDLGFSSAITKYMADAEAEDDPASGYRVLASAIFLHLIFTFVFWGFAAVFAGPLSAIWFDGDRWLYLLFVLACPLLVLTGDLIGALNGLREIKFIAIRRLLQTGILCVLGVIFVWVLGAGLQVAAAIYAFVTAVLFFWLLLFFTTRVRLPPLVSSSSLVIRPILKFALPLSGIYAFQSLITFTPVLLSKALAGAGATTNRDIGVLSIALLVGSVLQGTLGAVIKASYGYTVRWYTQKSYPLFQRYIFLLQGFIVGIYAVTGLLCSVALPYFINLVYGAAFLGASTYVTLVLYVTFTGTITLLYNMVLYSMGLPWTALYASLIEFLLYASAVAGAYALIDVQDWGYTLLSVAAVTGSIKILFLMVAYIRYLNDVQSRSVVTEV